MNDEAPVYRPRDEMRRDIVAMAVLAAMWLGGVLALGHLPARVPVHFALNGQADGWASAPVAALAEPALATAVWLFLGWAPAADPRRASYAHFADAYRSLRLAVVALLGVVQAVTLGGALGHPVDRPVVTALAVSGLLVVAGNLMPRLRPAWFVGIRTPWTLSNAEVWRRTHRLGGRLFVAAGLLVPLALLVSGGRSGPAVVAMLVAVLVPSFVAAAYSWRLYGRLGPEA